MKDVLWPTRPGETPDEARMRKSVNEHASAMLATLDGTIRLRDAPAAVAKARHRARQALSDFAAAAMLALAHDGTVDRGPEE